MKRIVSLLMTAVMIVCCAVPVSAETSGSYDYAAVHCSHDTVEDFGETALNKFVRDIIEIYQPQSVNLIGHEQYVFGNIVI